MAEVDDVSKLLPGIGRLQVLEEFAKSLKGLCLEAEGRWKLPEERHNATGDIE
eukprot:CAMPEP_0197669894 /NCGR_PEP_ID=MMETSP1338-20131121/73248_1 /TAXON_ID=43686 ORGANISM="Pelagodinium beii, Strain RCC1491" /NCGR_SAMPLE_ID=MMETSP1338 /ASSEMBLY_ACC=CAM_ASM_000754 /LENGTH=52 /DNA_ID=CAMNT_0043249563 /DNA_START=60 /DNA_END=216 /DNA_ORIENTATION=+